MGLISSLVGIGLGMATIGAACDVESKRKGFMTSIERDRYDQENAMNGIDVNDIERIARRCQVKPSKYGVLPLEGYTHCLSYVRKYANSSRDVPAFIDAWEATVKRQVQDESGKIKNDPLVQKEYKHWNVLSERHAQQMSTNNPLTFEITHWRKLKKATHVKRVTDIANTPAMSRILVQPPILRWSSIVPNTRAEFWTINGKPGQTTDIMTRKNFVSLYKACCAYCGYDHKL